MLALVYVPPWIPAAVILGVGWLIYGVLEWRGRKR